MGNNLQLRMGICQLDTAEVQLVWANCWIGLELIEGKNRQVRRITAAIGHPTLRLMRGRIGKLTLNNLAAGEWRELSAEERFLSTVAS